MISNPKESVKVIHALEAKSYTAAETLSSAIDCKGYRWAMVVVNAGVAAGSAEADVTVLESSDDGDSDAYAAISGAAFTQIVTANDQASYVGILDLRNRERYLKVKNAGDGSNAVLLSANVLLLGSAIQPISQEESVAFDL